MGDIEAEDEVAALTPKPTSTDGWDPRRWSLHYREHAKALHARLVELQTAAGVLLKAERLEEGPLFPHIDHRPFNPKADEAQQQRERTRRRFGLRRLYFEVEEESCGSASSDYKGRKTSRCCASMKPRSARNTATSPSWRPRGRPWATTAIEAVIATLLGAFLGHVAVGLEAVRQLTDGGAAPVGAVAGAVVGVIDAIRRRDFAEQARRAEIAEVRAVLAENDRMYQSILDEPETFTEWEEFSGRGGDEEPQT